MEPAESLLNFFLSSMPPRRMKNGREARGENQLSAGELVGGGGDGEV